MPKKLNHSLFERQPFSKQVLCTFTICSYMALNNTACTLEFINLYGQSTFKKHSADVLIPSLPLNIQTTGAEWSESYHLCIHAWIWSKNRKSTCGRHPWLPQKWLQIGITADCDVTSDARMDSMMPYLTPAISESKGLTNRIKSPFPVRIAGRCGLRWCHRFILLHFRPHVSPRFSGETAL